MTRIEYSCGCWYNPTLYANHPGTLKFNIQVPMAIEGLQLCAEHKQQVMNEMIAKKEKQLKDQTTAVATEVAKYKEALKTWDKETPTAEILK